MGEGICLGFESAQRLWRDVGATIARDNPTDAAHRSLLTRLLFDEGRGVNLSALPERTRSTTAPDRVDVTVLDQLSRERGEGARALHICVSRRSARRQVSGASVHLMSGGYPAGSFCRLRDDVMVASPELTFLQMACVLSLEALVAYGFELCGYFARGSERRIFVNCPALTSAGRIASFLERLGRLRARRGEGVPWGTARARRALAHVIDGAASPEEAVAAMVLSMPSRLGGYGLPAPRLNQSVVLGAACAELFGIDRFVCDLSWRDGMHVLECQGSKDKLRSRATCDLLRGNVLAADGRDVLEMDRSTLRLPMQMDDVAKALSRVLRRRWRRPSARVAASRTRLRSLLIAYLDGAS